MPKNCLTAAAILLVAMMTTGQELPVNDAQALPRGLEQYLEARVLEANGRFREAMDAYDRAVIAAPDVTEIRLAYASFLVDIGMAKRAVDVLAELSDPSPEGLRLRALAMAHLASRNPELLGPTEVALTAAIESNPGDVNLLYSQAKVLQGLDRPAEAEQVVADLRRDRPGNPRLTILHAELLRETGKLEQALELYDSCAGGGPMGPTCQQGLVDVLVELGRPGEAGERMLGWLEDIDLDSLMRAAVLLWEGGRLELSLETVQRVLVRAPDSARAQRLEAHLLSSLGRHDESVSRLRRLLKKEPNDLDSMLAMAWSLSRTGKQEKAREWLEQAWRQVGRNPGSQEAVRTVLTAARIELLAENPLVAREWLDRVDDAESAGVDYVRLLAETFRRSEQWGDGVSSMVRLQPSLSGTAQVEAEAIEAEFRLRLGDPRAWRRLRPLLDDDSVETVLAGLRALQTVERWEEVDRESAAAIDRLGSDRNLAFTRAAALERLGLVEESTELFRRLVESEPNDADAANYLGYMLADREIHLEEAYALILRAVAIDPENSAYLDSLGWVHFRMGDLDQAEHWLRRAVDLGGGFGDGTIFCHLGEVLLASGDADQGRHYLQLGLDMGCDDPDHARSLLERIENEE
jgi:tetratricopeptide (TPR) repeat protein